MHSTGLIRYLVLVAMLAGLVVLVHSPVSASPPGPDRRLEDMMWPPLSPHSPARSTTDADRIPSHATAVGPNCRYGVTPLSQSQTNWLPDLGAGWYLNFRPVGYDGLPTVRFVPVLRVQQNKNGCQYLNSYSISPALDDNHLGSIIAAHPGMLWVVGNEPDRGPNPEDCLGPAQDDTYPEVYARAYHDAYTFIKGQDPTAQVAIAGLVEVTPGRLQYLDIVWQTYRATYGVNMPVDVWNMHLYILPEALSNGQPNGIANVALGTNPALAIRESGDNAANCPNPNVYCWAEHDDLNVFASQVVAMRTWMKAHGQQNKPLILSEYSLLYPFEDYDNPVNPSTCFLQDEYGKCFTQQRVTTFMNNSFSYLETASDPGIGLPMDHNRLVQQWMWFSMNLTDGGAGAVSNLLTNDLSALTQPGLAYRAAIAAQPLYINLFPDPLPAIVTGALSSESGTGTVRLAATVRNNGNTATGAPITVSFYADAGLSQVIGSAQIPAGLGGCATSRATVSVDWSGLAPGQHPYWVKVDSTSAVVESNEADNVANGIAGIFAYRIALPVMMR